MIEPGTPETSPRQWRDWAALTAACIALCACGDKGKAAAAPLPPELAEIRCPADHTAHATARFINARLTFVCLDRRRASDPQSLRCDPTSRPPVCEDAGSFHFTRTEDGAPHAGVPAKPGQAPAFDPSHRSYLMVNFFAKAPPGFEDEPDGAIWDEGTEMLPRQFTGESVMYCLKTASVLG